MKHKLLECIQLLENGDFSSFKKSVNTVISENIKNLLEHKKIVLSTKIITEAEDAAAAEAEKQALFVDPNMAKEFFLFDLDYKGHTITVKSLGTGLGKPVVTYVDGKQFEVFTDREIGAKEAKSAIDKMIKRGIKNIGDLRKTKEELQKQMEVSKKTEKEVKEKPAPQEIKKNK